MTVGVLAFQGDFAEHLAVLRSLGASAKEVRTTEDLRDVTHLVVPGGESTVMGKFLERSGLTEVIRKRAKNDGLAIYGTCAGAIVLANNVTGKNPPPTLGLMDIDVERNAYGSQTDSFEENVKLEGLQRPVTVSFIRAPRITRVGKGVDVLATKNGEPILVRSGRLLASAFHPEVRGENAIHKMFLEM